MVTHIKWSSASRMKIMLALLALLYFAVAGCIAATTTTGTFESNVAEHIYERKLLSLDDLIDPLRRVKNSIDSKLFLYQTPAFQWIPSSVYKYADFEESLKIMATQGVAGKKFYVGEDVKNGYVYGMVNIAAFFAQSMKETIQYDACDENSWDLVNGKYPLSNACGQLGQSYQDYHCSEEEAHMECEVDPQMSLTAVTHAKWYGAPAPLYCGPKTSDQPFTGFWDYNYECNKGWANPPETCSVYEGQKAGRFDHSSAYASTGGRTDVEGCCWWGRGVIQTTGVCNFGKLNYYLGKRAADEGRESRYPSVDFCKDPEVICASAEYKELKWVAGMFYWMESVQAYNEGGWDYTTELINFVNGGMSGNGFIDGVSGIVNRGCHNPPCGTGALDGGVERAENFKKVLDVLFDGSRPQISGPSSGPGSSSVDNTSSSGGSTADVWYPNYDAQFAAGKCVNDSPVPGGRPTYTTGSECCSFAYAGQASNACVNALSPSSSEDPGQSGSLLQSQTIEGDIDGGRTYADIFVSSYSSESRLRTNLNVFSCDDSAEIPMDSKIIDVLFDYEYEVAFREDQASHLIPSFKHGIIHDLAKRLDCHALASRRFLRQAQSGLLGFLSADGSDVIDGEKSVCSKSTSDDGHVCLPVVGHIAIAVEPHAELEVILESKQLVLQKLQESFSSKTISDNVTYVGEHNFAESQVSPYTQDKIENSRNEEPKKESKPLVAVLCSLLGVAAVFIALVPIKRGKMHEQARTVPIAPEISQDSLDAPYLDTQNNDCQNGDLAITSSDDSVSEESVGSQNGFEQDIDVDTAQLVNDNGDDDILLKHTFSTDEGSSRADNNADQDCCPIWEHEDTMPTLRDRKPMEPP